MEVLNGAYKLHLGLGDLSNETLLNVLLYGSQYFTFEINSKLVKFTVAFLTSSKPFEKKNFLSFHSISVGRTIY